VVTQSRSGHGGENIPCFPATEPLSQHSHYTNRANTHYSGPCLSVVSLWLLLQCSGTPQAGARGSVRYKTKVVGSIADEVIGFFNLPNPSSRNMALGSTQPLTYMSTWNLPGG
jgi:hypothetical protein